MKIGSLFAGVGGIDLAFKNAGAKVLWANEIDSNAITTYKHNFNSLVIHDDIKNVDFTQLDKVDVLVGGFPCQAFSIAGYRKGFNDERGAVFFEILRAIRELDFPNMVFLENVKNIVSHEEGRTFKIILKELEKLGYLVKYKIMNTADYSDIPQNRERIYIIAFKNKNDYERFQFPEKVNNRLSWRDLVENNNKDTSLYYNNKLKCFTLLKENITNYDSIYQYRRVYVRENKSGLCPTLTANMGTGGHNVPLILDNGKIRKLSPQECFAIQGFPKGFILPNLSKTSLYKQAGNSVSVPVIQKIATNLIAL
ncbi:MAG: DNA cytosine methyltransferase [Alphaproteobacteria bacterium]|jgi:DNA (cytosine-5)-methyltransferase 1|nr:DNA cytosine methyltransferase [Alphaproteobacteria bacterium]